MNRFIQKFVSISTSVLGWNVRYPTAVQIGYDSTDDKLKFLDEGNSVRSVVTEDNAQALSNKDITATQTAYNADGAITIASHTGLLGKAGSAGAYTVAAPGAAGVGKRITLTTTTDFAHVVTFTGGTLWDGTAGANSTWTTAAVQGSSLTVEAISATKWNVINFNLGTIAP